MHPNRRFDWNDREEMLDFVSKRGFGHVFVSGADGPVVGHAPILITDGGRAQFHVSRRNRAAGVFAGNPVLISVAGRDAYQSASWYVSDNFVPTWLYETVEIEGIARELSEPELVAQLDRLSDTMEGRYSPERPWTRAKMTPGKFEGFVKAIVGFEVEPTDDSRHPQVRAAQAFRRHRRGDRRPAGRRAGGHRLRDPRLARGSMNRLAIFDCDGTLVDSGATIYRAVAETFAEHGIALPPPRECRRVIGLSLTEAMAALVPDASGEEHSRLTDTYKAKFFQARLEGRVEEPLFDGIAELLDALEADGWLLGVATGKSLRGLNHCLECHGIAARFISLQTADRHPSKPHPSMALQAMADAGAAPETTVVIGDTSFDMGMARAAGAIGIGAGWGYHDEQELLAGGAAAVADQPLDVVQLIATARENSMDDEALWKRRFLIFTLVRLAGLATFFLGIAIAYTGLVREGGWPTVGLIVAVMGLIDAVFAPRILKMQWEREGRE